MQTIALHHILLKSSLLAQDIAQELELGADFSELAREHSVCPSSPTLFTIEHDGVMEDFRARRAVEAVNLGNTPEIEWSY